MIFKVALNNKAHPEYGEASIPFPIPSSEYDQTIELLEVMGIGDARTQDCRVTGIYSTYPILNRLVTQNVNVEELDYLAKRLDSFSKGEADQFLATASKLCLSDIKDFINLTFCCQQTTVITSFSDLERVGKSHCLTINGGMPIEEYQKVDGQSVALDLIQSGNGVVTPYGVVYDNGMKLEQVYDGQHFPEYFYGPCVASVNLSRWDQGGSETLYLPCSDLKITRTLRRLGVNDAVQYAAVMDSDNICDEVCDLFNEGFDHNEHLNVLNRLAHCCQGFTDEQMEQFHTVFIYVAPQTLEETAQLAENLRDFTVVSGIHTAEDYGKVIAERTGIAPSLSDFLDYERLGQQQIDEEGGVFEALGYIAYQGTLPEIKEILTRHIQPTQGPQIGGLTS